MHTAVSRKLPSLSNDLLGNLEACLEKKLNNHGDFHHRQALKFSLNVTHYSASLTRHGNKSIDISISGCGCRDYINIVKNNIDWVIKIVKN